MVRDPVVIDKVFNLRAVLINPFDLTYRINNGPLLQIPAVYDGGVELSNDGDVRTPALLAAADILPGSYLTCRACGVFRLGAPGAGVITADAYGSDGYGVAGVHVFREEELFGVVLEDPKRMAELIRAGLLR